MFHQKHLPLTNEEVTFIHNLISTNKIHTADFVFERLIHFYENLITIIVSISAFLGIIGYLYIKNSHQRDIYDGIYSLFNSDMGLNLLKDIINKDAKKYFEAEFNKSLNYGDLKDLQIATQNNSEVNEEILKGFNYLSPVKLNPYEARDLAILKFEEHIGSLVDWDKFHCPRYYLNKLKKEYSKEEIQKYRTYNFSEFDIDSVPQVGNSMFRDLD
ncbi:hypothetical protein IJ707_00500, partial [bacterium]|nr:hypothetical protein [bacterium]